ncbi:hypothetical protein Lser_V15G40918 [Lactuca serriola]
MKLLDWMQHKFHQTSNEHLITEFAPRNSCASLTDLQYYPKSQYCYPKAQSNKQREKHFRKSFACIESARSDKDQNEQEPSDEVLFHGFLAIGTLAITEPETPTFATSVENITWKETEATENELNVINGELEKVLRSEGKEEGGEKKEDGAVVCPLQTYLFGSVVGLPETTTRKKEHRASLGELFQRTKMEEKETVGPKNNDGEKRKEKSAVHLMKKILKGRTLYPGSADKKPSKLQRMFHRKVHPENGAPKSDDLSLFPLVDTSKKGENFCTSDSDGNRECWIKSDTEYLVLEVKGKKDGK